MKNIKLITLLLVGIVNLFLSSCENSSANKESDSSNVAPVTETAPPETKPISIIEQSFYIPMSQGSGGLDEFVCLLPDGKFVRGTINYNSGDWIYMQNNKADYTGTYKIINDNLIEVKEKYKEYKYNWRFQFKIVETFGGKAFELRGINDNGTLTKDPSMVFTSSDIDVAKKLNFN